MAAVVGERSSSVAGIRSTSGSSPRPAISSLPLTTLSSPGGGTAVSNAASPRVSARTAGINLSALTSSGEWDGTRAGETKDSPTGANASANALGTATAAIAAAASATAAGGATSAAALLAPAAPGLTHRHIFGLKADVAGTFHYLDDNTLLYPAGHNVIVYNIDTKTQRFIHGSDPSGKHGKTEIVALAVSPNKRYVAVSERAEERALVLVYDTKSLKKRRTLSSSECMAREFVHLAFSPDSKTLLTLGGGPDWMLINWNWQKAQPLQISKIEAGGQPLYQCSYCPADPNLLCVTGKNTLRYFRIEEQSSALKVIETMLDDRDDEDYLCHSWITGKKMVVGTESGRLLWLDNALLHGVLRDSPNNGKSIDSIVSFHEGKMFAIGGDDGVLRTYIRDEKEQFTLARTFNIDQHTSKIKSIAISPGDDDLVVSLEANQAFTLKGFRTDVLKPADMKFEPLGGVLNHTGAITGLDICVRKPIIVTCGVDKTVRVWNYMTKTVELAVPFSELPLSVALHPSGLHLLVGFADKLRLMNILMDDIKVSREFPIKQCTECQFSNGGQWFAAVHSGLIQIYATYTCEPLAVFRGHTGNVKSLFWSLDDTSIVSAGWDGAVYERKLNNAASRHQEFVQKGIRFHSALCTDDGKIYAAGHDMVLREIIDRNVHKKLSTGSELTQLVISHPPQRMLFAGTAQGCIRSYPFPLPATNAAKDYMCHSKAVNRMRITHDDAFLFSISDDGCLAVFAIKEKDGRIAKRDRPDAVPFSEEILVHRSDLDEKSGMMIDLQGKVAELTTTNDYELRKRDNKYQEKMKEVTDKYQMQLEHNVSKIENLRTEKRELESECEEKINQLKSQHMAKLHAEDQENQKGIMKEVFKYQKLQEEMDQDEKEFMQRMKERDDSHQDEMKLLREQFDEQLKAVRNECKKVLEDKNLIMLRFQETMTQLEEDGDKEIEGLKDKYDTKLRAERDATLRLKGENGIMNKKFTALQKDIDDQKENIVKLAEYEEQLKGQIRILEDKIKQHTTEILEKDKVIGDKEKQMHDLKKDNQELEKFKFVLDYQIKELKATSEPRETEISNKREEESEMGKELEAFHKRNGQAEAEVDELKTRLKLKHHEIKKQRQRYRQTASDLNALANDLHQLTQHIQDPGRLRDGVEGLYSTHVTEKITAVEVDPDVSKEYKRQTAYLDRSVDVLKSKLSRDMRARKNDNMRIMQENVSLIKEINNMRREIKQMHQVQRQKELSTAGRASEVTTLDADWDEKEAVKLLEMQREQIQSLRAQIESSQARVMRGQPVSKERLAPVDEFARSAVAQRELR